MSESDDEIEDLRLALSNSQSKYYELKDQKDREVSELEFKLARIRDEIESSCERKLVEIEMANDEKIR
jgi:hypothetical protein